MNIESGRRIAYLNHIRQSITVILSTRLGTRLMREHFGSLIPAIIDQPANAHTYGLLVAAIYNALLIWEPRIVLQSVEPVMDQDKPEVTCLHIHYSVDGQAQTYAYQV